MKGIVLAGGICTRLYSSHHCCKQAIATSIWQATRVLPLSTLMLAGVRDILLITTPHEQPLFQRLLGDGTQLGISISYIAQPRPEGIAQDSIGQRFYWR